MIIKKFQSGTETEAIMLAKEELGKDAIVMNIKTIAPKGIYKLFKKPVVEITAAVDDNIIYQPDKPVVNQSIQNKAKPSSAFSEVVSGEDDLKKLFAGVDIETEKADASAIEQKLNNLQSMLEKQIQKDSSEVVKSEEEQKEEPELKSSKEMACVQLIYNQLVNNEVDEKYANQVISEIENTIKKDSTMDYILASIYQKLILKLGQPKVIELSDHKPKFVFFIGPTGVGKTTTIAKVASSFKLKANAKIAFLTADTYRIAAVEQLRIYANILGIPLKVVYTPDEMKDAFTEFEDYDLVFVDTAGRSHRNKEQRDDIEKLIDAIDESYREVYLVLSTTTKYKDLIKITEVYNDITNYNLLFTKLDETSCIGNILNIRMLTGAQLSYATFGQNVPDDISTIDAQNIAKQLLRGH